MPRRILLVPFLFLFLVAAKSRVVHTPETSWPGALPHDNFSYAEPLSVTTRHLSLDLTVDFDAKQLRGTARLDIENLAATNRLVLDTRDLTIDSITLDERTPTTYRVGAATSIGAPLTIDITPSTRSVTIAYRTSPNATGLLWNSAAQSYGRVAPYLYSQNEPIDGRSWLPVQDTPSVRMTYEATLRVPRGMLALMSAENPQRANDMGIYTFDMRDPIPSYLVALAVARLEFRPLSDRTGVYAEPELIGAAEEELGYIPDMLEATQRIAGPYRWGRYDVLLMPPTYVVGGMEHPRLNFIAPFSVATGNHPKRHYPTTLIAHEMSHSWSGDLATLATWNDVWLNEGITSYLTLRIIEEVAARDRADYYFFNDRQAYADYVSNLKDVNPTRLHREVTAADFEAGVFNTSAYTKGELFLKTLEDLVGRTTLDAFLRDYFATFSLRWVDDKAFLSFFRARVVRGNAQLEARLQLDAWVYGTGVPTNITAPTSSSIYNTVGTEASAFRTGKGASALPRDWEPFETDLFFVFAYNSASGRMAELDNVFHFSDAASPPVSWLNLIVDTSYAAGRPALERVLMRGGSNGLVQSLYGRLARTASGKQYALAIYGAARERYAPFVRSYLDQLLGWTGANTMKRAA